MLITDNSMGASDGKERDQLQAMIAVGSEFMTFRDNESTVQRSGEFVRIEKEPSNPQPRFALLHETGTTYTDAGVALIGNELLNLPENVKLRKRTRLYMSESEPAGDLPFREVTGFKTHTRISRYHGPASDTGPRSLEALYETGYTSHAGKRRFFSKGDGKLLLVREVAVHGDDRYFNDSLRALDPDPLPHTKARGLRAARVEVVEVDPLTGKAGDPVFSFGVHSGLSFDPVPRSFSDTIVMGTADMYDATRVFAAFSGVNYGSSLTVPGVPRVPTGGDAADTYAVCEPGVAVDEQGREYTSIIAVYPTAEDVYDTRGSGAWRLTCKRTTATGEVQVGKINFPGLPSLPQHYLAVRGISLHRLSPTRVALRVNVHVMQFGAGGAIQPSNSDAFFLWTNDNGATWTYNPVTSGFPGVFPYGGMLIRDKNSMLAFSWFQNFGSVQMQVHRITSSGTAQIGSIDRTVFSAGLLEPGVGQLLVPYVPVGFGGVVYRRTAEGVKRRLWMQFDPYWIYKEGTAQTLQYPASRPILLVSDDEGVTWRRLFLPSVWCFLVGFVVAIDEETLAVPVFTPRKTKGEALQARIHLSKTGGDSWKRTDAKITIPGETWADGNTVIGLQYRQPITEEMRYEQDISDTAQRYNRGELLPMVVLRDADGRVMPANPSRPWMANHRFKEPSYG